MSFARGTVIALLVEAEVVVLVALALHWFG
jgi:hypothetical protein